MAIGLLALALGDLVEPALGRTIVAVLLPQQLLARHRVDDSDTVRPGRSAAMAASMSTPTPSFDEPSEPADPPRPDDRRTGPTDESDDERLEREHEQLFHELRAIIPGAEVLFAFMLTVTFTQRFEQLTDVQRTVYYVTLLSAGISLLLLLAPASFHRVRFRRHDKERMMRVANIETIAALILISLAVAGTIFLITDVMYSTEAAVAVGTAIWLCTGALWWGLPLRRTWHDRVPEGRAGTGRAADERPATR